MDPRCVKCGHGTEKLYVQYSPGNIRLLKCGNCNSVADEYIECELMILIIDLILHKPQAYRHLLFNLLRHKNWDFDTLLWKSSVVFLCFDAYKLWILNESSDECCAVCYMDPQKNQAETESVATPPSPAITSCRRKKKEDATFVEDIKDHIDEFINASMDEHKSCFTKTVQKMFGMSKIVAQRSSEQQEVVSILPLQTTVSK